MRLKRAWQSLKQNLRKSLFLKMLRRVLFEQSHLSPYLPVMKEELADKILRLYDDYTYAIDETAKYTHHEKHRKVFHQDLSNLIFISEKCYDPINNWLIAWYSLVFSSIIMTYFMAGMAIFYGQQAWTDLLTNPFTISLNIICILVFTGDVFVQLNSGFLFRGMIIVEKERAMSRYIRYYILIDLLLIIILIITMVTQFFYMNLLKMIIVLKFIRMFEIDELYMRKLSTNVKGKTLYVIFKQFITIFVIAHTIGIIFYAIDLALTKETACLNDTSLCWLYSATTYAPIMDYGWRLRYFYSLYWGVNTIATISYGDIAPNNPQQTVYVLACFCFSLVTYGYVVNNIIKIILWARTKKDNFRAQLILYTTYMDTLQISKEVQFDFRDYLETQYFEEKERSFPLEEEMKSRLPVELREELLRSAYFKVNNGLEHILFSSPSIVKLLYFLEEKKFSENEFILIQGAPLTKLYYLQKGEVQLTCLHYQKMQLITTLYNPDEFLSLYQYFLDERASYTIKTSKNSTLYFLDKQKIEQELLKFTDLRENFRLLEDELKFDHHYKRIFYQCYFCHSNHHWYKCTNIFPNFSNVSLVKHSKELTVQKRIACVCFNAWKNKDQLQGLVRANYNITNLILRKIQERVYELKKVKQEMRNDFDIDVHHEWLYFKPDHNLSKFKQEWNKRKHRQTQPFLAQLPALNPKAFSFN